VTYYTNIVHNYQLSIPHSTQILHTCRKHTGRGRQQATAHLAKVIIFDRFSIGIDCSDGLYLVFMTRVQDVSLTFLIIH